MEELALTTMAAFAVLLVSAALAAVCVLSLCSSSWAEPCTLSLGNRSQVSAALSYPGTIKAFHFHRRQTDCWVPVQGMFQVALVDLRKQSASFGARNTLYLGALRPSTGRRPHRLQPPQIQYDWETQHK